MAEGPASGRVWSVCEGALSPWGFPGGSAGEESASVCSAGDLGSIPGLGRSPGEGKGCPLQYSGLENSMDCIVHEVAKSRTRLSDLHILFMCRGIREEDGPEDVNPAQEALGTNRDQEELEG